jgi:hypothetical protein
MTVRRLMMVLACSAALGLGCGESASGGDDGSSAGPGGKADDADSGAQGLQRRGDQNPYADLDPDFERLWHGDLMAEMAELVQTGRAHAADAKARAELHERWYEHYLQLGERKAAGERLSRSERKDFEAYERVFDNFPARDNEAWAGRAVHQKNHGCFTASFRTVEEIPDEVQKGLFVPGMAFDAVVRFSNGAPRYVHDFDPSSHGMAVKLLPDGVELDASAAEMNEATVFNMANVDFPVAFMFDPVQYRKTIELTSPDFEAVRADLGYDLSQLRVAAEALLLGNDDNGFDLRTVLLALAVNGKIIYNPLFQRYNSMSVFRLGTQDDPEKTAVKYLLEPCERELQRRSERGTDAWAEWTRKPHFQLPGFLDVLPDLGIPLLVQFDLDDRPDYLAEHARETLDGGDFCFQLRVQPFVDEANTPVEDPTVTWISSEDDRERLDFAASIVPASIIEPTPVDFDDRAVSDPIKVAEIVIHRQEVDTLTCEDLSFSVWDNVPVAHKPMGIANRMRWFAYRDSKHNRDEINGRPAQ